MCSCCCSARESSLFSRRSSLTSRSKRLSSYLSASCRQATVSQEIVRCSRVSKRRRACVVAYRVVAQLRVLDDSRHEYASRLGVAEGAVTRKSATHLRLHCRCSLCCNMQLSRDCVELLVFLVVSCRRGFENRVLLVQRSLGVLPVRFVLSAADHKQVPVGKREWVMRCGLAHVVVPAPRQQRLVLVISERQTMQELGLLVLPHTVTC